MTLRYIFHSGFLLETERCVLIFDYWMDPADVMREYMHTTKHVYVFASHFHEDHFTKGNLQLERKHPEHHIHPIQGHPKTKKSTERNC